MKSDLISHILVISVPTTRGVNQHASNWSSTTIESLPLGRVPTATEAQLPVKHRCIWNAAIAALQFIVQP